MNEKQPSQPPELVDEAPGQEEKQSRRPFTGMSAGRITRTCHYCVEDITPLDDVTTCDRCKRSTHPTCDEEAYERERMERAEIQPEKLCAECAFAPRCPFDGKQLHSNEVTPPPPPGGTITHFWCPDGHHILAWKTRDEEMESLRAYARDLERTVTALRGASHG